MLAKAASGVDACSGHTWTVYRLVRQITEDDTHPGGRRVNVLVGTWLQAAPLLYRRVGLRRRGGRSDLDPNQVGPPIQNHPTRRGGPIASGAARARQPG